MPVYIYQVDDVLVDTGPKSMRKEVIEIVKKLSINQVLLTHHHEDHTGNSPWIEKHLQIPQWIHPLGLESCKQKTRLPLYRAIFWHNREAFLPLALSNNIVNTEHYSFKIVHTPGHAEDHIVLIDEEQQVCLSGDLYLSHSPTSNFSFESVPELIRSLDKVLAFSFQDVYCSHRGHLKNGRRLLEKKRDFLLHLQETVSTAHKQGKTPKEIRQQLLPKNKLFQYISFFDNSPTHTINSIINDT